MSLQPELPVHYCKNVGISRVFLTQHISHSSWVPALSWLGLWSIQSLSRKYWAWGRNTPWMRGYFTSEHHAHMFAYRIYLWWLCKCCVWLKLLPPLWISNLQLGKSPKNQERLLMVMFIWHQINMPSHSISSKQSNTSFKWHIINLIVFALNQSTYRHIIVYKWNSLLFRDCKYINCCQQNRTIEDLGIISGSLTIRKVNLVDIC